MRKLKILLISVVVLAAPSLSQASVGIVGFGNYTHINYPSLTMGPNGVGFGPGVLLMLGRFEIGALYGTRLLTTNVGTIKNVPVAKIDLTATYWEVPLLLRIIH